MTLQWKKQLVLGPEEFSPSREDWEVVGAFNPGVAVVEGRDALLVRVAERPKEQRAGYVALPRWDMERGPVVDWVEETDAELIDPRVYRVLSTGLIRLTFISYLQLVWIGEGQSVELAENGRIVPLTEWEEYGVEDARITKIDDRYWITYAGASRHGVVTALLSTVDFQSFERHGIIFPPDNKDVTFFPERVGGRYVTLHRPSGSTPLTRPAMWIGWSDDLLKWGEHTPFFAGTSLWESGRVGAGTPPIRTDSGWLELYHGNRRPTKTGEVGCYQAAAMLMDGENPARILRRSAGPILSPDEPFEREGFVPDVVFPTGIAQRGNQLAVYYGIGDAFVGVAEASLGDVIDTLQPLDEVR